VIKLAGGKATILNVLVKVMAAKEREGEDYYCSLLEEV
jgi:hypothetical protein